MAIPRKTINYIIAGLILLVLAISIYQINQTPPAPKPSDIEVREGEYFLDIRTDTLTLEKGTLNNGWTLSNLLALYNVPQSTVYQMAERSKSVLNPRLLKAGQPYFAFLTQDQEGQLKYLVYQQTATTFIVYDFSDSLIVYKKEKPVTLKKRIAKGTIKVSLWNNLIKNGHNVELAYALNELFAWQIDFFALQNGDSYEVLYDERVIDDSVSIGIGTITGAVFHHNKVDYYAIPFIQDSTLNYFDQSGKNLKKAFLKAPLHYSRISSRFSRSRFHPVLRIRRPHFGVDYAAPKGTPVVSIGAGTVIAKGYESGGGNYIKIRHNQTYSTTYMHLSRFAQGIRKGVHVEQGERIGYVGATGLATGPHLDFRIYRNGSPVDPLKVVSPPIDSLKTENRPAFNHIRDSILQELSAIKQSHTKKPNVLP